MDQLLQIMMDRAMAAQQQPQAPQGGGLARFAQGMQRGQPSPQQPIAQPGMAPDFSQAKLGMMPKPPMPTTPYGNPFGAVGQMGQALPGFAQAKQGMMPKPAPSGLDMWGKKFGNAFNERVRGGLPEPDEGGGF